jgi:hypothetical protein
MKQLSWLLFFCWLASPAHAVKPSVSNRRDTTHLKRIIYNKETCEYTVEGSTVVKKLKYRHLVKDIPLKKYKEHMRKFRRSLRQNGILVMLFGLIIPLSLIVGVFCFAFLTSLTGIGKVVALLGMSAIAVTLIGLSFYMTIALGQHGGANLGIDSFMEDIIAEYNKEVEAQK